MNKEFLDYLIKRRSDMLEMLKEDKFKDIRSINRVKDKLHCTDEIYYQYCDMTGVKYVALEPMGYV